MLTNTIRSIRRIILIVLVTSITLWSAGRAADIQEDVQTTFARATALMQVENYVDALLLLRDVADKAPDRPNVFWDLGTAAAAVGEKQLALKAWLHYRALAPNDLRVVSKLIQSYQALDMLKERDQQRDLLLVLRAALPAAEREKMAAYTRDQFDAAGAHIIALEYFEPQGPTRTLYKFQALDGTHKPIFYYALKSDDSTSTLAAEPNPIGKKDRIYSLDKYQGHAHWTYQLTSVRPTYDAVRANVIDAAEGKLPTVSNLMSMAQK